ncbi:MULTISPECIES: flagellar filament capping protein FliD [unclassified Pseudoalteromonas]|uniref:flagellar filament capping protein FliD n=1 Tax=unclassified Pseudoalteromonas TaxID=194690 RepID=UPI00110AEE2B|nr:MULTISPECIES: flagellar filament capping protein FliD [unclassified Pseudoalteromonas]MCF2916803.1 flagellar filament capping protein FliD [Pseudoalteromonas sp. Cn5-37]TMP44130.1 flagellar hook protein FliD [Pseudoalteromonas sp. S1650]TMP69647.1 flagellar hook protein FliD [Pseudoalteromonas sp. S1649]
MAISFNGLGSGLAVSDIVDALVSAESTPFTSRLNNKEATLTTDISAAGALKSALEKLQTSMEALGEVDNYQKRSISGSDDFVTLSSDKEAQPGGYNVKVNNLATEHKLMSSAFAEDAAVGEGTLTIASGENSFDIDVSDTATLSEIRDAINDSKDNDSVTATIITDDNGQHLVLSAKNSGVENAIKVTATDADGDNTDAAGLSALAYDTDAGVTNISEVIAAIDASITIDGNLTVTSSDNEFANVIDGVTITAKKAHGTDDDDSTLKITENNNNIKAGLNSFIESYNELLELSNNLGKSGEDGAGVMAGDSMLRGVMSKLRQQLTSEVTLSDGSSLSLSKLGVEADRYGKLSLDTERLNEQVEADVDLVQEFFIGENEDEGGFAQSFDELMSFYTDSDGIVQNRIDSKQTQLDGLDDERIDFARKMESLESRLYAQYNSMDLLVAQMNSTSSYVQAQLDNMPGVVKQSK